MQEFNDLSCLLDEEGDDLEVIEVFEIIERNDGSFVNMQLMSDGNMAMSMPYYPSTPAGVDDMHCPF